MKRRSLQFRLSLTITMLTVATALLSIPGSSPPTNLVSTVSAQEKGGVVKPKPKPKPRSTPRPSTSSRTPRRTTAPAKPRQIGLPIEMVLIPAGTFMMGSPNEVGSKDEHPQHRVTVQSFYMGKYEVTQAQYQAVMGTNPSDFKGDDLPVDKVSWDNAKEFCRKLSQMTGKEYRLPSEAEWEYACRVVTTGDYAVILDATAWYRFNSGSRTHPVGQKQPNSFGLYDMRGNVWEWCEDVWHNSYNGAPTDGSAWVNGGDSSYRMIRGGSWNNDDNALRSAHRGAGAPVLRVFDFFGLRVVVSSRSS